MRSIRDDLANAFERLPFRIANLGSGHSTFALLHVSRRTFQFGSILADRRIFAN